MKKTLLFLFILSKLLANAQLNKGITEEDIRHLHNSTSVFFVGDISEDSIQKIQKLLDTVWTFNKIIVAPISKVKEYPTTSNDYSLFKLDISSRGVQYSSSNGNITSSVIYIPTLSYFMDIDGKKRVDFIDEYQYTHPHQYRKLYHFDNNKKIKDKDYNNFYYNVLKFSNFNLYCIKDFLKTANIWISNEYAKYDIIDRDTSGTYEPGLSNLKNDTLYISVNTFKRYRVFSGKEKSPLSIGKRVRKYKHPYKVITEEELTARALNAKENFYYLQFYKTGVHGYFFITNAKTGCKVFKKYYLGDSPKKKYFKYISREITRAAKAQRKADKAKKSD